MLLRIGLDCHQHLVVTQKLTVIIASMAPLKPARAAALAAIPVVVGAAVAAIVTVIGPGGTPAAQTAQTHQSAARPPAMRQPASGQTLVTRAVGVTGTGLFAFAPVQAFNVGQVSSGPVRIGHTSYTDSVRFACDGGDHISSGDLDYVVTGYDSLVTTIAVAPGQSGAAAVSFFNNGSGSQAAGPYQVSPGHPRLVRVSFPAASQLEISCTPAGTASRDVRLALANPALAGR
jgi:hypothetical protein